MTCAAAMFTDFVSVRRNQTTEDALQLLREHGIRALPVLDAEGAMVGRFDLIVLLSNVLPALTVDMRGTGFAELLDRNLHLASAQGVESDLDCAQRLRALLPIRLEEIMDPDVVTVHPTTPLLEGVRLLVQYRGPLGVVERGERRLIGLITVQSAMGAIMDRNLNRSKGNT